MHVVTTRLLPNCEAPIISIATVIVPVFIIPEAERSG